MAKKSLEVNVIVVLVTCPSLRVARGLSGALIRDRLAACVNIIPHVESIFRWEGRVDRSRETLLVIKTTTARFQRLRKTIIARHPYDVPEILGLPLRGGSPPYLRWVVASVS